MAHATSHPFVYDCGTCSEPVHHIKAGWVHSNRRSACQTVVVIAVPLMKTEAAEELTAA